VLFDVPAEVAAGFLDMGWDLLAGLAEEEAML